MVVTISTPLPSGKNTSHNTTWGLCNLSCFNVDWQFKNRCFQILDEGFPIINARREITVLINPRFGIRVEYGGRIYNTIRYLKPQNKNANTEVPQKVSKTVEPHLQLRHSSDEWKAIWWMEDYNLSLKFLYELFFEKQQSAS